VAKRGIIASPRWRSGIVGHDGDAPHALGSDLGGDLRHADLGIRRLAAGHGDGGVDQDLVGHRRACGDGGADGERAAMGIGAVAHVGEDVLRLGEVLLADPGHALAAHVGEQVAVAVHVLGEVVAADAGQGMAALGHARRGVVRAARAEEGRADRERLRARAVQRLQLGQAGGELLRAQPFGQACGQPAQDHRRIQLGEVAQRVLAVQARAGGEVVQRLAQLGFEEGAAVLHHQDALQPAGEEARALGVQRPGEAHLPDAQPHHPRQLGRDAGIGQGLLERGPGLAAHGDAEARLGAVLHDAVEAVEARESQRGRQLHVAQPLLDRQGGVLQADMHVAGIARVQRGEGGRVHHQRHGGVHRLGHAFHADPGAGMA
jgi:hypothetical protein